LQTASESQAALVTVERRDLAVDPVPVDLSGELRQLVLELDDLVQPRSEQIASSSRASSVASLSLRCGNRIMLCK
jgi:hypothetical protein